MADAPLLLGKYRPPKVRKGDVVACLFRDADCVVTGTSDGRIPWPLVKQPGVPGRSGVWVNEDLARAIQMEGAVALKYWFGVGTATAWRWRCRLGVSGHWTTGGWTAADVSLLGTDYDEVVAKRVDRTTRAVRCKRVRMKIPAYQDRRRKKQ